MSKSKRAATALASLCALIALVGCDAFGAKEESTPSTSNAVTVLSQSSAITLDATNLGDAIGTLVTHSPENLLSGNIPYLPVLKTDLYSGNSPYLTFTFNKAVKKVYGSSLNNGVNEANDKFVFPTTGGVVGNALLLADLPVISDNTVRFVLPSITTHTGVNSEDDGDTLALYQKYIVDFYVQTTDGDFGRLTIGFYPMEAQPRLGAFGDSYISLFANTAEGQATYSLYLLDQDRVFFLNRGNAATHTNPATPAESVGNQSGNAFDTYWTRYANGTGVSGTYNEVYGSLDALANHARVSDYVELRWTAVENATEYAIYTTDEPGNTTAWTYVGSTPATPEYVTYDFCINPATLVPGETGYSIDGYRAVRIVPKNNIQIGTEGEIRLVDTVRPVTSRIDSENALDSFNFATSISYNGHLHGTAETDGEIEPTGTKALMGAALIPQPDINPEEYVISNVSGTLTVTTTAPNGLINPITITQVQADNPSLPASTRFYQLGNNAVGALDTDGNLTVFVHLRCYLSPSGNITYNSTNTAISGDISVTYTDLSGNYMISRTNATTSKNSGIVIFSEQ